MSWLVFAYLILITNGAVEVWGNGSQIGAVYADWFLILVWKSEVWHLCPNCFLWEKNDWSKWNAFFRLPLALWYDLEDSIRCTKKLSLRACENGKLLNFDHTWQFLKLFTNHGGLYACPSREVDSWGNYVKINF